jgi:imidazolonepropionase-like amidohydrolase
LRVGRLFDGESVLTDADLIIDAQQVLFVGEGGSPPPAGLAQRDGPDAVLDDFTALPCLIEAHAHLFLDGATVAFPEREAYLRQRPEALVARARVRWPKILQCGVGTVRDAGDRHGVGLALARDAKARAGALSSQPFIDSPGAAIHHKGRYGSFMGEPIEDHLGPKECVAARVADGADRIKLLVSGIINFKVGQVTTPPQMSAEEVRALVSAARALGRQTFAHASGAEGVENSVEGGVTTVEHGFFIRDDQLSRMPDRRIGWLPTFAPVQLQIDRAAELGWNDEVVGHLQRIIEAHQSMLQRAGAMGVPILAGSDAGSCGVPHGIGFLDELCHMETAGLSPLAVLHSATGASADLLDFPEPVGRLAPGRRARFILTRHDPLATVSNLRKDKTILFDGTAIAAPHDLNPIGL